MRLPCHLIESEKNALNYSIVSPCIISTSSCPQEIQLIGLASTKLKSKSEKITSYLGVAINQFIVKSAKYVKYVYEQSTFMRDT